MLSEKMQKAMNEQINAEFYSAYLYLSMSAWFAGKGLAGFENWMKIQAQEETSHAMKLFNHVFERGGTVTLEAIEKPDTSWDSPLHAFRVTRDHERKVTSLINGLMNLAVEERDFASQNFLQWFIAEQVEEEASAEDLVNKLEFVKDSRQGVFMLDRDLATRSFMYPPAALSGEE